MLGLVNGCFYAVLSLGLAVIFGLLRIVNFAHGAFFMVGAFGAWMLAIEYVDCPLGNHGQPYPAVRMKLRPKRRLALGFGGTVMALTMIPVVNFIAMPVGVAAATALYLDELRGD